MSTPDRPLIGITIGPSEAGSPYLQQRATYPRAIEASGGVPVLIPPLELDTLRDVLGRLDGMVFPGGADVDPARYGEAPHPKTDVVPELDRLEIALAEWALTRELPTLGICRGQQLLNVVRGGSLVQHVDNHRQTGDRTALTQPLRIAAGSRLAEILGTGQTGVNHMHHQAVRDVGAGLKAVAWAADGTIEGLEGTTDQWLLMVQFHPEELFGAHEPSRRLFDAFVSACRAREAGGIVAALR